MVGSFGCKPKAAADVMPSSEKIGSIRTYHCPNDSATSRLHSSSGVPRANRDGSRSFRQCRPGHDPLPGAADLSRVKTCPIDPRKFLLADCFPNEKGSEVQTEHEERTMRKLVMGGLAAVIVTLGLTTTPASAAWVTRTAYRWDPACCRYVPVTERVWVPDRCRSNHHYHHQHVRHSHHCR